MSLVITHFLLAMDNVLKVHNGCYPLELDVH